MKEIMILVAVAIAIILAIDYRNNSFANACRAAGGTPVIGTYNKTCYEPGIAIDVQ